MRKVARSVGSRFFGPTPRPVRALAAICSLGLLSNVACEGGSSRAQSAASALDAQYSLVVNAPSNGATAAGSLTVTGVALGFVNVEVWDANHQSPPLARVSPKADGTFSVVVDTTKLPTGSDAWTVWGWDSPAGQPASHWDSVPLTVTVAPPPPTYALTVSAPANGATLQGTVTVTGVASGFVNVEVWDAAHQSPPLARATPQADGTFSATVDTAQLANGSDAWSVWGWDSPAGQPATHSASAPLNVTISNAVATSPGTLPYAIGLENGGDSWSRVEGELGRPMDVLQTYNWDTSWDSWASVSGPITDNNGIVIVHPATLSQALISASGSDLATAASGGYDQYYQQFAQNLANAGNIPGTNTPAIAVVRIGWEMNGNWFPWSIENSSFQVDPTLAANYAAAFRRLAGFVRQASPNILIDWCINQGGGDPTGAYPGDDVVDIVGMDLYEQSVTNFQGALGNGSDFLLTWLDSFSNATYGANAPAGKTGGKKLISFPEWQATADDGSFITQMAAWMNARGNRISYWNYWDDDTGVNPGGSLWENASINAAFVAAWKGTSFGGTIPFTNPPGF